MNELSRRTPHRLCARLARGEPSLDPDIQAVGRLGARLVARLVALRGHGGEAQLVMDHLPPLYQQLEACVVDESTLDLPLAA